MFVSDGRFGMRTQELRVKSPWSRLMTSKAVAERAGVHQTTVCLALRFSPKVGREVGDRVRRIAKEMGYYPRAAAQLLRSRSTGQIALIVAQPSAVAAFSEGLIARMLGQIVDTCMKKGIRYTIDFYFPEHPGAAFVPPHSVVGGLGDGALVIGQVGQALRDWLDEQAGFPWVSVLEPATYWVQIAADQATTDAVNMLYKLGHRRIAHAAGPQEYTEHCLRHKAFLAAARRLNLELPADWATCFGVAQTLGSRLAWARTLLNASVLPTAVITSGIEARVLIAEAINHGLSVPRDLSVMAWAPAAEADAEAPVLTALYADCQRMASVAMDTLYRLMTGEQDVPRLQAVPALMASGESVGPPPSGQPVMEAPLISRDRLGQRCG